MARRATGSILRKGARWTTRITLPDGTRKQIALPEGCTEEQARAKAQELSEIALHGGRDGS